MTSDELRIIGRKLPFIPLRVILATGDQHDVRHPELMMAGRRSAIIGLSSDPQETTYERTLKVDLLHIVGIEDLPKTERTSNGTS